MNALRLNRRQAARYLVYGLLALNIFWFFRAEFIASSELLATAAGWTTLLTVFSETLDTIAWVALVLLFELEVAVLPPKRLRNWVTRWLSVLRAICYAAIIVSLYGYWSMWQTINTAEPLATTDACALADQGYSYLAWLDDYPALTTANCGSLAAQPLAVIAGTQIIGTAAQLDAARLAAIVDLINALAWLIVVIIMEAEIWLKLQGQFRERWLGISEWLLAPLYLVLLGCTLYWLIYSDFLDFWDAFLWLIAFAFIELDILDWQSDAGDPATVAE